MKKIRLTDVARYDTKTIPDPETSANSVKKQRGWWLIEYPYTFLGYNRGDVQIGYPHIADDFDK
jgi:hypothetical protein